MIYMIQKKRSTYGTARLHTRLTAPLHALPQQRHPILPVVLTCTVIQLLEIDAMLQRAAPDEIVARNMRVVVE